MLIRFISNPEAPTWWGFLLAGLMFLSSMMQTLILHQYFHCIFVSALRLRTAIMGVLYRKVSWGRAQGEASWERS
jgi:ATP-binding cassette subfamily C (CFTR/MRP) protein 3